VMEVSAKAWTSQGSTCRCRRKAALCWKASEPADNRAQLGREQRPFSWCARSWTASGALDSRLDPSRCRGFNPWSTDRDRANFGHRCQPTGSSGSGTMRHHGGGLPAC
jgi:hypothetical protein